MGRVASVFVSAFFVAGSIMAGAAPGSATPGDHAFTINANGLERRYAVHVPPTYDGKTRVALVVMLHGGGGTGKAAAAETGWDLKGDKEGFLAVFPDATAVNPKRRSSFALNPQLWNDGSERFYAGQNKVDDIGFLNAMLDDLARRFAVDESRVYLTGFSNGASMCFRAGEELSARIAAIAPVAGACWQEKPALDRPVPMCYLTGTDDPLNIMEGGVPKLASGKSDTVRAKAKPPVRDSIRRWADAIGCSAAPAEASETDGIRIEAFRPGHGGAEVVYVTVEGLGHTWAGGRSLLPEFMVGKTSDKIKATDLMWDFFKRHALPPQVKSGVSAR